MVHQSSCLEVYGNLFAHVHAVLSDVHSCSRRDGAVGVEDVDGLQSVCLAEVVVVDVVCGCHFQTSCAELDVDVAVFDDWYGASHHGHDDAASAQPCVLYVLGVDAHCGVAHDGLWSCGCDDGEISFFVLVYDAALLGVFGYLLVGIVCSVDVVFEVVEF